MASSIHRLFLNNRIILWCVRVYYVFMSAENHITYTHAALAQLVVGVVETDTAGNSIYKYFA